MYLCKLNNTVLTKEPLYDKQGRPINYLRLAVTDRCNLRCFYCMPEEGVDYIPRDELLTYEEMVHIVHLVVVMGINKVRITGGEPFVRKDMMKFLASIGEIKALDQINITTNGLLTAELVPHFKKMGIKAVNLSLDTLDANRFFEITRRQGLDKVLKTLDTLLEHGIRTKINAVVMDEKNIDDIIPLVELTKERPIDVRFIEEMPFNGSGDYYENLKWDYKAILAHIQTKYPDIERMIDPPNSTSYQYRVLGFKGSVGLIAAYSRTFCGTCNRLRITARGILKTCLYDEGVFNIKDMMRAGATDEQLEMALRQALSNRAVDGFEAESRRTTNNSPGESMSTIGG